MIWDPNIIWIKMLIYGNWTDQSASVNSQGASAVVDCFSPKVSTASISQRLWLRLILEVLYLSSANKEYQAAVDLSYSELNKGKYMFTSVLLVVFKMLICHLIHQVEDILFRIFQNLDARIVAIMALWIFQLPFKESLFQMPPCTEITPSTLLT